MLNVKNLWILLWTKLKTTTLFQSNNNNNTKKLPCLRIRMLNRWKLKKKIILKEKVFPTEAINLLALSLETDQIYKIMSLDFLAIK